MSIACKDWNIQEMTGYEPITTCYMDFSVADHFGIAAVKNTYKRAFSHWKGNYKYLTELVMALNWKIWEHYEKNAALAQVYNALWEAASEWASSHLKGDDAGLLLPHYGLTNDAVLTARRGGGVQHDEVLSQIFQNPRGSNALSARERRRAVR